jgi:hypothetical protein
MPSAQGKLGKITFVFYSNVKNSAVGVPYSPMYNPTSFTVSHNVAFDGGKNVLTSDLSKKFRYIAGRTLTLKLFFDGTGASPSSIANGSLANGIKAVTPTTVNAQIEEFISLGYQIQANKHKPNYILVVWGTFLLTGVLKTASVNYLMFAPDGTPLRAELDISILENVDAILLAKELGLLSPDLSKSITVVEGDTLPLLCYKEYNDASLYVKVAEVNNLKNYRKLTQGMELLFPPINNLV